MSKVEWKEPPVAKTGRKSNYYYVVADELRARPLVWAIVAAGSPSMVTAIRTGRYPAFVPAGTFEATARKRPDGKHDIYARFVGGAS